MELILPKQPETYLQLLRRSIVLYRLSFRKIVPFAFLLSLTVFIPRLIAYTTGQDIFLTMTFFSPHHLWLMAINLTGLFLFIAIIWHMHCVIVNQHEPMIQDIQIALKKIFYVFIASILQALILVAVIAIAYGMQLLVPFIYASIGKSMFGLLTLICIFFAESFIILYAATLFIFIVPLIAIENKGIISALERSILLVWNHWLRTIVMQMTPWVCFILLLSIMKFILRLDIHIYFSNQVSHPLWVTLLQLVVFALFIPWVAAVLMVQLKDLELRKHILT